MPNETFYLDGVDARSAGIYLQRPLEFSEAVPVYEAETIPGRNGDFIWETGSYENRSGSASCFCLQKDVEKSVSYAGRFLTAKKGYRRLETSDDPDHFWMARVENSPQIAMRLRTLAPFEIGFDCKPQRFLKSGENSVVFTKSVSLFNPYGQVALPLVFLNGSIGADSTGWFKIGDCKVDIWWLDNDGLYLDSDTQNAYNNSGNQNLNINAPTFPVLKDGENQISWSDNITSVEIIPRWWEL